MEDVITLVRPDAPMPASGAVAAQPRIEKRAIRFGILNNSKGNADHLLDFVVEGVKKPVPFASVIAMRKDNAAAAAPAKVLDQLAAEADFVVSAMAD